MITFLLFLIYIVFIGLGLPDSVFGAAWPAMHVDLNASISQANFVTIPIYFFTSFASFFSVRLINKFGIGLVTAISTALTAIGLLGCALANALWIACVSAVLLGLGAGAIDSALNNYVATHYKSTHMNFMHCFYGVGVAVSPYILSLTLSGEGGWRQGYLIVFIIQCIITVFSIIAFPFWKKVSEIKSEENDFTPVTLTLKQMAKTPKIRMAWLIFFATCALEFTVGVWGCTYLVGAENFTESNAARYMTFYYLGITLGRFTCGFISTKLSTKTIVYTGYTIVGVAIILMLLPLPPILKGVSLFMIGFGNGPTFPNLTHNTPNLFGKEISQSIVGTQMVACNIGICIMPPVFGLLAEHVSVGLFPVFILAMFMLMAGGNIVYDKLSNKVYGYTKAE